MLLEERSVRARNIRQMGPEVGDGQADGVQGESRQSQHIHKSRVQDENGEKGDIGQSDDRGEVEVRRQLERVSSAARHP